MAESMPPYSVPIVELPPREFLNNLSIVIPPMAPMPLPATKAAATFPRFGELPKELQVKVWVFAAAREPGFDLQELNDDSLGNQS